MASLFEAQHRAASSRRPLYFVIGLLCVNLNEHSASGERGVCLTAEYPNRATAFRTFDADIRHSRRPGVPSHADQLREGRVDVVNARGRSLTLTVVATSAAVALGGLVTPSTALTRQTAVTPSRVSSSRADARIARLLPHRIAIPALGSESSSAILAVDVWNPTTGSPVYSHLATRSLRAASNMKLVTAVTALEIMGRHRKLLTLARLGSVSGSGVHRRANVTVVGGGDPLLTSADLNALAVHTLRTARVRGITSLVVHLDDSQFPAPTMAPGWAADQMPDTIRPVRSLVRDQNLLMDVATDAATYFARRLSALGASSQFHITSRWAGRARSSPADPILATTSGHTVEQAVDEMLLVSDNQTAEMLFRLSALASGRPATWGGAEATARAMMTSLGVPLTGVVLVDGSGLSRTDRQTARSLTTLLTRVIDTAHYPRLWPIYRGGGMPIAGRTGSLAGRYHSPPSSCAAGIAHAKTGSLHDVLSLSGVTLGADGSPRAFSLLLNNPPTSSFSGSELRAALDGLVATVTGCW